MTRTRIWEPYSNLLSLKEAKKSLKEAKKNTKSFEEQNKIIELEIEKARQEYKHLLQQQHTQKETLTSKKLKDILNKFGEGEVASKELISSVNQLLYKAYDSEPDPYLKSKSTLTYPKEDTFWHIVKSILEVDPTGEKLRKHCAVHYRECFEKYQEEKAKSNLGSNQERHSGYIYLPVQAKGSNITRRNSEYMNFADSIPQTTIKSLEMDRNRYNLMKQIESFNSKDLKKSGNSL